MFPIIFSDGYDPPIGTDLERQGMICQHHCAGWFGLWHDVTGFGRETHPDYLQQAKSYHTGVDFNYQSRWGALGIPVYAVGHGFVIFQQDLGVWGNITIIKHPPLLCKNDELLFSRYGHMQNVIVGVGDFVCRGQQIGEIGTGDGRYIAHLHYDLARTAIFEKNPSDWPGMDIRRLERHYLNPKLFITNHRPEKR